MADLIQANLMHKLFRGSFQAHGEFTPDGQDGKKIIGHAATVRLPVTDMMWLRHLEGKPPSLGIIPINGESTCMWGVIDIDDYNLDFVELLNKLKDTPLVCCKSKSGGAWLFIFASQPIPAKEMRIYLTSISSRLGLGNNEIFPKQDKLDLERGDIGNWLNMPYFGETRLGVRLVGADNGEEHLEEMNLKQFIEYANKKSVNNDFFSKGDEFNYSESVVTDGPPCLQIMSLKGFPNHTRNTSLFNLGIYLKKSNPGSWKEHLALYNDALVQPPLEKRNVDVIIKSLENKEYRYQCDAEPLRSFCNAKLCKTRRWGISDNTTFPFINSVTKVMGDDPLWYIYTDKGLVVVTSDELYDQRRFGVKCMSVLSIVPSRIKQRDWLEWVKENILNRADEVQDDSLSEYKGLTNHFGFFITTRLSSDKDQVGNRRVWHNSEHNEISFKVETFMEYLRFRKVSLPKASIMMFLRNRGMRDDVFKDKNNKSIRCRVVPLSSEEIEVITAIRKRGDVL